MVNTKYIIFWLFLFIVIQNAQTINVWIDCDPGLDDTFALLLAGKSKTINLIGVSTSAGNSNLNATTKNTLDILYNIGRDDVPVVRGSEELIHGTPKYAEDFHGADGLGGVKIPESTKQAITENRFEKIRDIIMNSSEKVVWANFGALTNLCFLLRKFP
jgi:inosine-uridine nucleoside N-ribohydrolase